MSVIETIPTTEATIPPAVRQSGNGTLPTSWLRSFDGTTRNDYKLFAPIAYAMQAMHIAAKVDGFDLATTGRYRSYAQQETLFLSRYQIEPIKGRPTKQWNGNTWYQKPGTAMAATPGTSNHGWGCADDICECNTATGALVSIRDPALAWLRDNSGDFGFALDTRVEPWHWHWYRPGHDSELTQRTVDVLAAVGIAVPDLSTFGFTAPAPTPPPPPPEEDDVTQDQIDQIVEQVTTSVIAALTPPIAAAVAAIQETPHEVWGYDLKDPAASGELVNVADIVRRIRADTGAMRKKLSQPT